MVGEAEIVCDGSGRGGVGRLVRLSIKRVSEVLVTHDVECKFRIARYLDLFRLVQPVLASSCGL